MEDGKFKNDNRQLNAAGDEAASVTGGQQHTSGDVNQEANGDPAVTRDDIQDRKDPAELAHEERAEDDDDDAPGEQKGTKSEKLRLERDHKKLNIPYIIQCIFDEWKKLDAGSKVDVSLLCNKHGMALNVFHTKVFPQLFQKGIPSLVLDIAGETDSATVSVNNKHTIVIKSSQHKFEAGTEFTLTQPEKGALLLTQIV
ncbi:MAG: hypothetical protein VB063_14075 [Bacteroides graminisolvens]|nr:hypothetical protein [Bacteroides graminisolvens]